MALETLTQDNLVLQQMLQNLPRLLNEPEKVAAEIAPKAEPPQDVGKKLALVGQALQPVPTPQVPRQSAGSPNLRPVQAGGTLNPSLLLQSALKPQQPAPAQSLGAILRGTF